MKSLTTQQYQQRSKQFDQRLLLVKVKECGEDFVYLPDYFQQMGAHISLADNPDTLYYLRKSVAHCLSNAAEHFYNLGYQLLLKSAYRTLSHQRQLFQKRFAESKNKYPDKSKDELLLIANTFTAGIPVLAAHTAGAAVDVLLLDGKGQMLDFYVPYPHGGRESVTDFADLPANAKRNRNLLKSGMEKAGFTNYPFEYWHYSIGDVCAAYLAKQASAKYSPVDLNLEDNSLHTIDGQQLREFFTI